MLKKIQLLFAFALALPAASYGLVGGPFDNGDYSNTYDDRGIYQASMRFPNGQGFCQFGSNVDISNYIDQSQSGGGSGGSATTNRTSPYSFLNRSVIYYKGMTYLGQAWGSVDMSRKSIEAVTNGNSDVSTTQTNAGSATQNQIQSISAVSQINTNNGRGFTCNTAWTAKIGPLAPILKFVGDGTLSVLNPDGTTQIQAVLTALATPLATSATQDAAGNPLPMSAVMVNMNWLVNGKPAGVRMSTTGATSGQVIADATSPATPALSDIYKAAFPSSSSVDAAADKAHIKVYGMRKFFLSRR